MRCLDIWYQFSWMYCLFRTHARVHTCNYVSHHPYLCCLVTVQVLWINSVINIIITGPQFPAACNRTTFWQKLSFWFPLGKLRLVTKKSGWKRWPYYDCLYVSITWRCGVHMHWQEFRIWLNQAKVEQWHSDLCIVLLSDDVFCFERLSSVWWTLSKYDKISFNIYLWWYARTMPLL